MSKCRTSRSKHLQVCEGLIHLFSTVPKSPRVFLGGGEIPPLKKKKKDIIFEIPQHITLLQSSHFLPGTLLFVNLCMNQYFPLTPVKTATPFPIGICWNFNRYADRSNYDDQSTPSRVSNVYSDEGLWSILYTDPSHFEFHVCCSSILFGSWIIAFQL